MSNLRDAQTQDDWQPITRAIVNIDGVFLSQGLHAIEKVPGARQIDDKSNSRLLFLEVKRGEGCKSIDTLRPQDRGQLEVLYAIAHGPHALVLIVHSDPNTPTVQGSREVLPYEYQVVLPWGGLAKCLGERIATSPKNFKARLQKWMAAPSDIWFTDPDFTF